MHRLRFRDGVILVLLVAAAIVCVRLGFWQLTRLDQRVTRNQSIQAKLSEPPIPFQSTASDYQTVFVEGRYLHEYEIVLRNRALNDVAGFHLVTPLQTETGAIILVDRGWIPYDEGSNLALDAYHQTGQVHIQGVLQPGEAEPRWGFLADRVPDPGEPPLRAWRVLNIEGIQSQIPLTLHNQFLALTSIQPISEPMPKPDFNPDLTNGPHLSYAIQWFSFAGISLIGGIAYFRRMLMAKT